MDANFKRVIELADASVQRYDPTKLKWQWGEALYTYSLCQLDDLLGEARYQDYCMRYLDTHIAKGYRVDQSDTAAPALTAYALLQKTGDPRYAKVVVEIVDYLKTAQCVLEYMPNHLGHSPEGRFYPKSVWVDSVMMYGVFSSWYGTLENDSELSEFANRQPGLFARYLQDPQQHLFYHSYWVKTGHTWPNNGLFWARGNGWIITGLPMVVAHLGQDSPGALEAIACLRKASAALLHYQRQDGFFETVLKRSTTSYRESSATALIASGWMQGVAAGYLDETYRQPALNAFQAVVDSLEVDNGLLSMPMISAPTIPLPLLPYLGYKLTPRGRDWHYGIAAMLFAGINYHRLLYNTGRD